MNSKLASLVSILFLTFLLVGCATPADVEETQPIETQPIETQPVEVVEETQEEVEVIVSSIEDYLTLSQLAVAIRNGDIGVGAEYGLAIKQRFHTIHTEIVGMSCLQCHVTVAPEEVAPAPEGAPGIADRRVCLGCHTSGPGLALYDPKD